MACQLMTQVQLGQAVFEYILLQDFKTLSRTVCMRRPTKPKFELKPSFFSSLDESVEDESETNHEIDG